MTLLREQIDDAVELRPLAHRDLHGNDLRRQQLLDLAVHLLEVGVLLVHQGYEEQPRDAALLAVVPHLLRPEDRKSTRLNSSHSQISYAVFCLKKKNKGNIHY